MTWTWLDEEKRLCQEWLREPLINPETGHPIERNGPTFNVWRQRCKNAGLSSRPVATKTMTWRKCQAWRQNPYVNPDSGRDIEKNGPTYKWIAKQCDLIEEKEQILQGDYYLPDRKGMVPCVLYRGTWYTLRIYDTRKVWGPLNRPAKNVKLCYYADTWDYHYNHYRPVFIDSSAPKRLIDKRKPQKPRRQDNQTDWLNKKLCSKEDPKHMVDNVIDFFISPKSLQ